MLYELIGVVSRSALLDTSFPTDKSFQVRPGRGVNEIKEYTLHAYHTTIAYP
jgi:hypothetical protein